MRTSTLIHVTCTKDSGESLSSVSPAPRDPIETFNAGHRTVPGGNICKHPGFYTGECIIGRERKENKGQADNRIKAKSLLFVVVLGAC